MKIFLGLFLMIAVSLIDIEFFKKHAYLFYFIGITLLILATFYGVLGKRIKKMAKSWRFLYFNLQN